MYHRPFEDWLLNDQPLTPNEKRDLDTHIRTCKYCAALAETGLELRSVRMVSPKPGLTSRFQKCLAAQRIADRRRRLCGLSVILLSGAGLLFWLTAIDSLMWVIWENHYVHHAKDGSLARLPDVSNLHVAATEETEIENH